MKSLRHITGSSLVALIVAATPALAQVSPVPNPPPPTREELNRAPIGPDTRAPSKLTVEGGIERAPCPLADPRFQDVTVTISGAVFDNLKVASPDILRPAYESFVGKTVPIAAVCEIRDAAATILRREGYLAAVQVPAQKIENGVVHFDVLMAKLVSVQVRGDAGKSERLIASYLNALTSQEVFNEKYAERYLLLARDLPGYDVRLTLRPAKTAPGEVIGEVTVVKTPFSVDANIQNYGSHAVGRFGGLLRLETYDVLGQGDRLAFGYYATPDFKEQHVLQLGYDMRIGGEGLTIGGRFTHAWTKPDTGNNGKFTSHTLIGSLEASYPFVRTQSTNLRGAGGMDFINQTTHFNGNPFNQDHLRVAYARIDFDMIDRGSLNSVRGYSAGEPKWRLGGSLEFRKGLSILDATDCGSTTACAARTPSPTRPEGEATAALVRFNGTAEYRPLPIFTFALSPRAQYTRDPLLSYEEFSAGNFTAGRGYDPGTLTGDSGVGFQAEIRFGTLSPRSRDSVTLQPYAFVDHAWVWNRRSPDKPLKPDPQELTSIGGGIRGAFGDHARIDVTVAFPLDNVGLGPGGLPATQKDSPRLLVSLSTKLWPWLR